jgi:colanic acid biosynthesis glycosyl transferase WcaI
MPTRTLLILTQVYVPDPASVGQHMHDAAAEIARRGVRVQVLTSARGYDDPSQRYDSNQTLDGVHVRRLPLSSFGKRSIMLRLLGGVVFLIQATVLGLFTRRLGGVLVSTSPPMCPAAALVLRLIRRVPVAYWAMDLNPDQMIEAGRISARSAAARLFDAMNRGILRRAGNVIALDRYMSQRLNSKVDARAKTIIIPPWPHVEEAGPALDHADNPFRSQQNLEGRFVFMYSGNISPVHPVGTILEAAGRLADDPRLLFLFIGGGLGRRQIEQVIETNRAPLIRLLPYQPLEHLRLSLSAADVHLVAMGTNMVGIVHPCKVYGALAVGRPVLLLGPRNCHVSDILEEHDVGWRIDDGDVDQAVRTIRKIAATGEDELREMGRRGQQVVRERFSKTVLCRRFGDVLEQALEPGGANEC